MLTELDARHSAAAQMHSAAMQRVRDLWDAAEKQKRAATEAALAGERLLEKVGTEGVDLTHDELLEVAETARREEAKASIGEARVKAAMRAKHEAHIEELRSQRDILQETFDGAVTKLIEYGDLIDSLRAELDDAIAAYDTQGQAVMEAHRGAAYHNSQVSNERHHHNPILGAMGPAEQPRVTLPQVRQACSQSSLNCTTTSAPAASTRVACPSLGSPQTSALLSTARCRRTMTKPKPRTGGKASCKPAKKPTHPPPQPTLATMRNSGDGYAGPGTVRHPSPGGGRSEVSTSTAAQADRRPAASSRRRPPAADHPPGPRLAAPAQFMARQHMTRKGMRKLGRAIAANLASNAPRRLAKEASKAHHSGAIRMQSVVGWKPGFLIPPVRRNPPQNASLSAAERASFHGDE